jgi:crossover junction endodeoxyribonuclease RuvC
MTTYIGIDPGVTGAVAALAADGRVLLCADLPVVRMGKLAWCDREELVLALLLAGCEGPFSALIERAQPMPRQGVSSTFGYGTVFGSILASLHGWASIDLVAPAVWKRAMGLTSDKSASLDRARMLFPDVTLKRARDHNRAEALLLAEYHRRRELNVGRRSRMFHV